MSRRVHFASYELGSTIPELEVGPVEQMDLVRYAGASGDFNPIHVDVDFAKRVGLDGTIAHGMYVMALLGRLLSQWTDSAFIRSFGVKFKGMVLPGDVIVCRGKIKSKKEENGEKILGLALEALVNEEVRVSGDATVLCD